MRALVATGLPTVDQPLTLGDAQLWLNVDSDLDSRLVDSCVRAACVRFESLTGRAVSPRGWQLTLSQWENEIQLDRSPLVSIEAVKYYPAAGGAQATVDPTLYYAPPNIYPAVLALQPTSTWPDAADRLDAIQIDFTAGAVDDMILQALRWDAKTMYDQRNDVVIGNIVNQLPENRGYQSIVTLYRVGGVIA